MTCKTLIALLMLAAPLAACSTPQPRIVQITAETEEIRLSPGMATQLEMPAGERVVSVTIGNPALVTVGKDAEVVNLLAMGQQGETNVIVRAIDKDGKSRVHQYRLVILPH